jgi:hypothetical protein
MLVREIAAASAEQNRAKSSERDRFGQFAHRIRVREGDFLQKAHRQRQSGVIKPDAIALSEE